MELSKDEVVMILEAINKRIGDLEQKAINFISDRTRLGTLFYENVCDLIIDYKILRERFKN